MSSELIDRFVVYLGNELGRRPTTIAQYRRNLAWLERYFGKPAEEIGPDDLRAFKISGEFKSETVKSRMVAVRQFHAWGVLEGLWEMGHINLVRTPPINDTDTLPPLTTAQAGAVLAACQTPLEARLAYFGLYLGTRVSESARITPENWHGDVVRFRGSKNARTREIPVHPELAAARRFILRKERAWKDTLQKIKPKLEERVGFPFTTHQLRKCFADTLYDAGIPDEIVGDLLGHTGSVTRRYAPVTLKKRREAISRLMYPGPRSITPKLTPDLLMSPAAVTDPDPAATVEERIQTLRRAFDVLGREIELLAGAVRRDAPGERSAACDPHEIPAT